MWLVCLPEADMSGQVAAIIGAALSSGLKAAGVTAAAIGEGVGGVVVERNSSVKPVVCISLQNDKNSKLVILYLAVALN